MSDSNRLDTIEIKLAHLEQAMATLSDTLIRQQRDIEMLQAHLRHFRQQLEELESPTGASADGYEKPPHY